MIGPYVAAVVGPFIAQIVGFEGEGAWRFALYLFGAISLVAFVWLNSTTIEETKADNNQVSFRSCLQLLGNKYIALMVLGIFAIVGVDVAINSNIGAFLQLKIGVGEEAAKYGKTVYFFAKMIGTFVGGIILLKGEANKFLKVSSVLALLFVLALTMVGKCNRSLGIGWLDKFGCIQCFSTHLFHNSGALSNALQRNIRLNDDGYFRRSRISIFSEPGYGIPSEWRPLGHIRIIGIYTFSYPG